VIYWKKLEDVMCQAQSESPIRTGRLVVDLATRIVSVDNKPVRLTGKEYGILELLCQRKGTTLTKEMFLNHLYAGINEPGLKIIDVFVCKLRKKLAEATGGKHYIETVWGRGYALRDPAGAAVETPREDATHSGEVSFHSSRQSTRGLMSHPAG
jgi:two-component system cell cycle response regulator CtrA